MHYTAEEYGKAFFNAYTYLRKNLTILDIGSKYVDNDSVGLRDFAPKDAKYIGLDFDEGKSVDIVLQDAYHFPLPDNYADIIVTSYCFEHSEFFWLTFMESLRVLKPEGVIYINAPSNGFYHRYPTDNWRFYPDAGKALVKYAYYTQKLNTAVLESFIGRKYNNIWNDFVTVIIKNEQFSELYPNRIYNSVPKYLYPMNIWEYGEEQLINVEKYVNDEDLASIDSYLYEAASRNDLNLLKALIDRGANIDSDYIYKATPLSIAVQNGFSEVVNVLLKEGANTEIKASNGLTSLCIAAQNKRTEIAKLLIEHNANIECKFPSGANALYVSSYRGDAATAILLLKAGANKDVKVEDKAAIQIAAENGHEEIVKLMVLGVAEFCKQTSDLQLIEICRNQIIYIDAEI